MRTGTFQGAHERQRTAKRLALLKKIRLKRPSELETLPESHPFVGIFIETASRFFEPISDAVTPGSLGEASNRALRHLDEMIAQIPETMMLPGYGKATIACKTGCNYCCSIRLTVSPPFVLALAAHLKKTHTDEQLAALRKRIDDHVALTNAMSPADQILNAPLCPLNVDSLCVGYEARPLSCRTYHSLDLNKCIEDRETKPTTPIVPQLEVRNAAGSVVQLGAAAVLESLGLADAKLEFVPALQIALNDDTAAERYIKGEDVFAAAYRPEVSEAHQAMTSRGKLGNLLK